MKHAAHVAAAAEGTASEPKSGTCIAASKFVVAPRVDLLRIEGVPTAFEIVHGHEFNPQHVHTSLPPSAASPNLRPVDGLMRASTARMTALATMGTEEKVVKISAPGSPDS